MALLLRVVVALLAFLAASVTAGIVITIGILVREWDDLVAIADPSIAWFVAAFFSFIVSGAGLVPAAVVIGLAEAMRVRSALFYAAVGGLGAIPLYHGWGFAD